MFLGGVYLPRQMLPEFLIRIGDYTPPGVQALLDAWQGTSPQLAQLAVMALITVVAGAVAAQAVPLGMSASPDRRRRSRRARSIDLRAMGRPAVRLVPVRHARRVVGPGPRVVRRDTAGERLVTAGLVALAALWVYFGLHAGAAAADGAPGADDPRTSSACWSSRRCWPLREYLFFLFLITGFFHAPVLRPWPVADRRRVRHVGPRQHGDRRVPDEPPSGGRSTSRSSSSRRS